MTTKKGLYWGMAAAGIAVLLAACAAQMGTQQVADAAIHIGSSDLGGVVTSAKGPEAGVWVIAETTDLPTKFAKIVVTDDHGRYVMPDLPQGELQASGCAATGWSIRPRSTATPGKLLNLHGGRGAERGRGGASIIRRSTGIRCSRSRRRASSRSGQMKSQPEWLNQIKTTGCMSCHALGTKGTRTMPKDFAHQELHRGVGAAHRSPDRR